MSDLPRASTSAGGRRIAAGHGRHSARFSLVLLKEAEGWEIAPFHNTLTR